MEIKLNSTQVVVEVEVKVELGKRNVKGQILTFKKPFFGNFLRFWPAFAVFFLLVLGRYQTFRMDWTSVFIDQGDHMGAYLRCFIVIFGCFLANFLVLVAIWWFLTEFSGIQNRFWSFRM